MPSIEDSQNPLLIRTALPVFDRIKAKHVIPAVRQLLKDLETQLIQAEETKKNWDMITALNEIEYQLHCTWGPITHLLGVDNSKELREAHETVQKELVDFYLRLSQSQKIYHIIEGMAKHKEKWDDQENRIIELRLREAKQAGVGIEEGKKRKHFNTIVAELSRLQTKFSNNILDATKAYYLDLTDKKDTQGLPSSVLLLAAQTYHQANASNNTDKNYKINPEQGPWRITLEGPSYIPFMQHSCQRDLREKLYRAFIKRASSEELDNTPIIAKTLQLRQEQAHLLGYPNFAAMRMDTRMAKNVNEVYQLLEELRQASWEIAKQEYNDLQELARSHPYNQQEPLKHWDIAYYAERLREKRFGFTEEELRPYFPFERVLNGLFSLAEKIFGIFIVAADGQTPIWHKDVRYFKILDGNKQPIASFYLDPYSRPENKRGGAWMDDCRGRRKTKQGKSELPVAYLICNAAPPVADCPAVMNFREVETLFHEFGHGLQHMLTNIDHMDIAGINGIEWDAVELPSQFMENWCYHHPTLLSLSSHVDTKETLPDELFEKIKAARNYRIASNTLRQIRFSLIDMELHDEFDPSKFDEKGCISEVQKKVEKVDELTSFLPSLTEDRFLCSFSHIFAGGYAAGYYSYKWAEVLSADAFSAFEEVGLDNSEAVEKMGRRFRQTILGLGGSKDPTEIFQAFRGRKPSTKSLLKQAGLVA